MSAKQKYLLHFSTLFSVLVCVQNLSSISDQLIDGVADVVKDDHGQIGHTTEDNDNDFHQGEDDEGVHLSHEEIGASNDYESNQVTDEYENGHLINAKVSADIPFSNKSVELVNTKTLLDGSGDKTPTDLGINEKVDPNKILSKEELEKVKAEQIKELEEMLKVSETFEAKLGQLKQNKLLNASIGATSGMVNSKINSELQVPGINIAKINPVKAIIQKPSENLDINIKPEIEHGRSGIRKLNQQEIGTNNNHSSAPGIDPKISNPVENKLADSSIEHGDSEIHGDYGEPTTENISEKELEKKKAQQIEDLEDMLKASESFESKIGELKNKHFFNASVDPKTGKVNSQYNSEIEVDISKINSVLAKPNNIQSVNGRTDNDHDRRGKIKISFRKDPDYQQTTITTLDNSNSRLFQKKTTPKPGIIGSLLIG